MLPVGIERTRAACAAMLFGCLILVSGRAHADNGFDIVVLGARGGIQDGNLSAYLVRPHGEGRYVACDAGTLVPGLNAADRAGDFADLLVPPDTQDSRVGYVLHHEIAAYMITHAHLDHVAGLVIASPDDSAKPLYALPSVIRSLSDNLFNWAVWPNFGSTGRAPVLGKFTYRPLTPAQPAATPVPGLQVTAYPLDHGGVESTAFVLSSGDDVMAFFGDTGADRVQHSRRLETVWRALAGAARHRHLRGLIIESSYDDSQPDATLFGHLKPELLLEELHTLERLAGGHDALKGLPVLVEHVKYSLKANADPQGRILRQLEQGNDMGVVFVMPEQGQRVRF